MFELVPDEGSDIPFFPDNNSDITREAAQTVELNGDWTVADKAISVMRVKMGLFTVNVSINTVRKANRLVVTFMGARGGGKDSTNSRRPMFARRNWETLFDAPILAISDPLTEIEWNSNVPRAAFYTGTFEKDLVPELNALIDVFCDKLGVSRDGVLMYGSSAGGTSAILVGSRRTTKTGIVAVCPFLRPDKYREQVVAIGAREAMGGDMEQWDAMMRDEPWRMNPLVALKDGQQAGVDIRLVVGQNLKDKSTINRHFPGLWRRWDIDPEGGVSPDGRVMTLMFDSPEAGHGHEPPEFSRPLWKRATEFFDAPVVQRSKKVNRPNKKKVGGDDDE
jgi:hypothetical protein